MNQIFKSRASRLNSKEQITLFDRFALAFAGGLFAFLTIIAYVMVGVFMGVPKLSGLTMKLALSPLGLMYISTFTILGFVLGPTRLANLFSFAWGTHPFFESEKFRKVAIPLILIVLVIAIYLRSTMRGS